MTAERFRTWMTCLAATGAGLALLSAGGWLGPELDGLPDRRAEYAGAEEELRVSGELARLEADARARCARQRGENGGVILLQDGAVVCSDKYGRHRVRLAPMERP